MHWCYSSLALSHRYIPYSMNSPLFCFPLLCCDCIADSIWIHATYSLISFVVFSLFLGLYLVQSHDCHNAYTVTMDHTNKIDQYQNTTKHNKAYNICILFDMYVIWTSWWHTEIANKLYNYIRGEGRAISTSQNYSSRGRLAMQSSVSMLLSGIRAMVNLFFSGFCVIFMNMILRPHPRSTSPYSIPIYQILMH